MNFQQMIMCLNQFWADQGCVIWQPHNVHVGAGTSNPATALRALGPEPWNVAYPEPSDRPADGRYGENPNRWYEYYQYQVILKPDPVNHIELYLKSLEALGIHTHQHDIRFVEDNWQSPSLGAWGLGWEVWLDGLEITQYTYFQQAFGIDLDPVCVEITYGLERIAMFLQGVPSIPEIEWLGDISYGDVHLPEEIDYCKYNFDYADVGRLQQMYDLFEAEAKNAIAKGLVLPAHDYLLSCSHVFNVMDARGAVGVTQRAHYFSRMREVGRQIAAAYLKQRESLGYPFAGRKATRIKVVDPVRRYPVTPPTARTADLLLEIGTEELPAQDIRLALEQLEELVPKHLGEGRLNYHRFRLAATPRRLVIYVEQIAPTQESLTRVIKGPAARTAFDAQGEPTKAGEGFARSLGVQVDQLEPREIGGKTYLTAVILETGRPSGKVIEEIIPKLIAELKFPVSMHWNQTQVTFSRPIRWLVGLLGEALLDFEYAGVPSDRITYGARRLGSPTLSLDRAESYWDVMQTNDITVDVGERRALVHQQVNALAAQVDGQVPDDPDLLDEVTNLIEQPVGIRGSFSPSFLTLPVEVLVTVMKKHQRYFSIMKDTKLVPYFVAVANGGLANSDLIRAGNEEVLRARFSDADFFYKLDTRKPLSAHVVQLEGLVFQEGLGSYMDKTHRLKTLVLRLAEHLHLSDEEKALAYRTAELAKADLVTNMVREFTSLQGIMGRYYAQMSGEEPKVAAAIQEHYLPRFAGDQLPTNWISTTVALADRLDSLVGLFAIGLIPDSTADPYGLRRMALGILQILIEKNISISLPQLIEDALSLLPPSTNDQAPSEVVMFLQRRLQGLLLDQGFRNDLVEAVLGERGNNPALAYATTKELNTWVGRPDFVQLLRAYARSVRIVRESSERFVLTPEYLTEPASQRLYETYLTVHERIDSKMHASDLLDALLLLVTPINDFFNEILVMHENKHLRNARLALLQHIGELPRGIVDLTKVAEF